MNFNRERRSAWIAALLVCWLSAGLAQANDSPVISGVNVGFAGKYKTGHFAPVWVQSARLSAEKSPTLQFAVADADGALANSTFPQPQRRSGVPGETYYMAVVKPGRPRADASASLNGANIHCEWQGQLPPGANSSRRFVLALGDGLPVEKAARLRTGGAVEQDLVATVTDAAELPENLLAYDGVDAIVASTEPGGVFDRLNVGQCAAIEQWVKLGGTFVVVLCGSGERAPNANDLLANLLPGKLAGVGSPRDTRTLETFVETSEPIVLGPRGTPHERLRVSLLDSVQGHAELTDFVSDASRPIVVRSAHGFGVVHTCAVDLLQPALVDWPETPKLLARVLGFDPPETGDQGAWSGATRLGYNDLSGQLGRALDQFAEVRSVPFPWIFGLIFGYFLLVAPGDYFLLKRLGWRREFTWLTFSCIVLAVGGLAWWLADRSKGRELALNQVTVFDFDSASGASRGLVWANLYSPRGSTYDLALAPALPSAGATGDGASQLVWHGLPGQGMGGMDATRNASSGAPSYAFVNEGNQQSLAGVPLAIWSSRAFQGRWWNLPKAPAPKTGARLVAEDFAIRGEIENPLPFAIDQAMLVHGSDSYRLRDSLAAGGTARIDDTLERRNLKHILTRRRVVDDKENKDINTRWDPASDDLPRIVEIMLLHNRAGGASYTVLRQKYQPWVDLSGLVDVGRAVLVGRMQEPAAGIICNGERLPPQANRSPTFVRIVYAVEAAKFFTAEPRN